MIAIVYGPTATKPHEELFDAFTKRVIRVSQYWPAHIRSPGVNDMQVIAVMLRKLRGITVAGKIGRPEGSPVWDLKETRHGDERVLEGTPLGTLDYVSDDTWRVLTWMWQNRDKRVQSILFDRALDWWHNIVLSTPGEDQDLVRARRDRYATETLHWLSKSVPVVMIADEEWVGVDREVRQPCVPVCVAALADLVVHVDREITVESKRSFVDLPDTPSREDIYRVLGLLFEPDLEEQRGTTSR